MMARKPRKPCTVFPYATDDGYVTIRVAYDGRKGKEIAMHWSMLRAVLPMLHVLVDREKNMADFLGEKTDDG
jgi:hypothetical protein